MSTEHQLIEWADICGISIGRDEGSPYPTLEQLAKFSALACAQPPAPEQQAPKVTWPITEAEHQFHEKHSGGVKPEMERAELPPLPEPVYHRVEVSDTAYHGKRTTPLYDGDQMHAYARAALLSADSKAGGEPVYKVDAYGIPQPLRAHSIDPGTFLYTRPQQQAKPLTKDDVEWVVNDNAELGVKIGDQFFWLYKGESLVYEEATHDDGTPMMWRIVGKREFGECCHPVKFWKEGARPPKRYTEELIYTHGLSFGAPEDGKWKPLPAAHGIGKDQA